LSEHIDIEKSLNEIHPDIAGFHVYAWDEDGNLVLDRRMDEQVISISRDEDADITIIGPLDGDIYIRQTEHGVTLIHQSREKNSRRTKDLVFGSPAALAGLTWIVVKDRRPAMASGVEPELLGQTESATNVQFLNRLTRWVTLPMNNADDLRAALGSYLELVVDSSMAQSGMIVSLEQPGFSLVSVYGLTALDAEHIWLKIPDSICEEILKTQAKVILPEGLRNKVGSGSTIFVRNVRSMVGFPIMAEGRVIAILFLGFRNVLRDLSATLQEQIEDACALAGLVLQRALLRQELDAAKLQSSTANGEFIPAERILLGSSSAIRDVYKIITRIAPVNVPTLVLGETGTGKELAARELHRLSDRKAKNFVAVNASALPESLFESELFGHKKGAFTGALSDHIGLIERAHEGTLFIDEIGELPLTLQTKLLRVLQDHAITRIGETSPRPVDFRLITATHRNLQAMVQEASFREDLYYRIAGAIVHMPRLKDRPGDVMELANFFKQRFAKFHNLPEKEWSTEAIDALEYAEWKGNVRELEHAVARAMVMSEGLVIKSQDLGLNLDTSDKLVTDTSERDVVEELELAKNRWLSRFIQAALIKNGGNRAKTAKALGIGQRTLFRYIEQFDLS
jgi:transcriptional regulator with GAF, ATPase, and Fis domain